MRLLDGVSSAINYEVLVNNHCRYLYLNISGVGASLI